MVRVRTETTALRQDLESTRRQLAGELQTPEGPSIERLEEEQQLLSAKVQEQYQTKIESTSKYRMRLSGAVLMNLFTNRGAVNDIDFPSIAVQYSPLGHRGSTGASVRQSLIGFEVFGPQITGAQVSADVQFDFAGGFPETPDGVALGLPRLRTGVVHLVWPRTSVIAGQDLPFISPLSPSSVASLAVPAFSYSGNLWTWTPQIRVERRVAVTDNSGILLQGGILDPLTGELPDSEYYRMPQAGEASRQPAYASRIAWDRRSAGGPLAIGIGGYYSRQDWAFHRNVDAWAVTSDWIVPMPGRLEFSGEMYRGRAVGGLGGGIGRSTIFSGPITDTATQVRGLNSTGGWAQL
jgi:hypothetical protein